MGVTNNVVSLSGMQQRSRHCGMRKFNLGLRINFFHYYRHRTMHHERHAAWQSPVRLSEMLLHFVAGNNAVAISALGNVTQQLQLSFGIHF